MRLTLKRLRRHAGLVAAIFGVTALTSAIGVGIAGHIDASATAGVQSGLAQRSGGDLAYQVVLRVADDAAAQDEAVRAAIAASFADVDAPIAVDRTVAARLSAVPAGSAAAERTAVVMSIPALESRAELVEGEWAAPGEVAVQADAAAALGVRAGDTLAVGDVPFPVAGLWRATDHLDPRWFGNPLVLEGTDDREVGPLVLAESDWARFGDVEPRGRWTLTPSAADVTAADLHRVVERWEAVTDDWRRAAVPEVGSIERSGGFTRTAEALAQRIDGLRAIEPVALLLLAAIALVTLNELARLLSAGRAEETRLLWSRGASRGWIAASTAAEAAVAAVPGAAVGAALAGLVPRIGSAGVAPSPGPVLWIFPTVLATAAVLLLAIAAYRSAPSHEVQRSRRRRSARIVGAGSAALLAAAAALSVWQLRLYGSPVIATADGGSAVDPITVLAPALALVAFVVLALLVVEPLARRAERLARSAPVPRMLAARGVARRLRFVAAPIVVVALAAGSTLIAAGYAETWEASFDRTTALRAGADLSIRAGAQGISAATVDAVAELPGVTAVAAVRDENLLISSENGSILAAAPDAVAALARTDTSFDSAEMGEAIRADVPGPALPADATEVTLEVEVSGFAVPPAVALQVSDSSGVLRAVQLQAPAAAPGGSAAGQSALVEYVGSLPPTPAVVGASRILAIDVQIAGEAVAAEDVARFRLASLTSGAGSGAVEASIDEYWIPESPGLAFSWPTANVDGDGFTAAGDTRTVRMVPSFTDDPGDEAVPPIVISERLADRFDIAVGDRITFPLENGRGRITAPVTAIAPVIPGAQDASAVLLDIAVIQHYILRVAMEQPRTQRLWVGTDDAAAAAAAARAVLPANTRMQAADDPAGRTALGSAATALRVGALGCVLLAVIAVAAAVRVSSRERRDDVPVLRALGLRASQQAAIRRTELGAVLGYGLGVGLVAGTIVILLAVPPLARAAVPDPYPAVPTELGIDLAGGTATLALLALALVAVVALAGAAVAAAARDARTADRS